MSKPDLPASPSPTDIRAWRISHHLTQSAAASLVCTTCRVWQQWEAGDRRMHPAFWALARIRMAPAP